MSGELPPLCVPSADGHCAICADEATVARVTVVDRAAGIAELVSGQAVMTAALDLVDDVAVGDLVLVHMGFAIARVEGATAQ